MFKLHGYAIIPTIVGFGCNVPAVMATRILESQRERFITAILISIGVPCVALQAMVVGLVGEQGLQYAAAVATPIAVEPPLSRWPTHKLQYIFSLTIV